MNGLSKMELEGMKNGCFPMDKDAGIEACKKYREALEAQGYRTWLKWFTGSLYTVEYAK